MSFVVSGLPLDPFRPLSPSERAAVEEEAHRLNAFHAG